MNMKNRSVLDYAFSVGRIRALERFLIRQEVFEEAVKSDLSQALRLFTESDLHTADMLHVKNSEELEIILNKEMEKLKSLIRGLLLDDKLRDFIDISDVKNIYDACNDFGDEFLKDYAYYFVDMNNIKTFLRFYILKEPIERLEEELLREGFIPKKDFLKLYTQDIMALLQRLEYIHVHKRAADYTYYLGDAIQRAIKENSFVYLEKAINDFLISILKPAKYVTFGPVPVIAYYFAKVNELNLIRMIILAKLNAVSEDLVNSRLNAVYA